MYNEVTVLASEQNIPKSKTDVKMSRFKLQTEKQKKTTVDNSICCPHLHVHVYTLSGNI